MLDGRTATVERIFVDYDDKVYLGVTVDDDPGQELMRETGRFLFFFAPEVEVVATVKRNPDRRRSATHGSRTTASAARSSTGWRP